MLDSTLELIKTQNTEKKTGALEEFSLHLFFEAEKVEGQICLKRLTGEESQLTFTNERSAGNVFICNFYETFDRTSPEGSGSSVKSIPDKCFRY